MPGRNKRMAVAFLQSQGLYVSPDPAPPVIVKPPQVVKLVDTTVTRIADLDPVVLRSHPAYVAFLDEFLKTPRTWKLNSGTLIRTPTEICPPVHLANQAKRGLFTNDMYEVAAISLGMPQGAGKRIANAADDRGNPAIRRDLMIACGLMEGEIDLPDPMDAELATLVAEHRDTTLGVAPLSPPKPEEAEAVLV